MLKQMLDAFTLVHWVVVLLAGAFHAWLWIQRGLWVPRYIHIMALAAALIMSGLVYGVFVFCGGALSAPDNESS